jgi:hypothetical protein
MVEEKTAARGFMMKDYSSMDRAKQKDWVVNEFTGRKSYTYTIDRTKENPYPCWNPENIEYFAMPRTCHFNNTSAETMDSNCSMDKPFSIKNE